MAGRSRRWRCRSRRVKAQPRIGTLVAEVLEGEIRSKVGEGPEKTYTAGKMFLETPGQLRKGTPMTTA